MASGSFKNDLIIELWDDLIHGTARLQDTHRRLCVSPALIPGYVVTHDCATKIVSLDITLLSKYGYPITGQTVRPLYDKFWQQTPNVFENKTL